MIDWKSIDTDTLIDLYNDLNRGTFRLEVMTELIRRKEPIFTNNAGELALL
jgi:hypothetical protein